MFGERKRILVLVLIMILVALTITGSTIFALYRVAFEQQKALLTDIVKSRARLFETMVRSETNHHQSSPEIARNAALDQLEEAAAYFPGIGQTGEFTLAKRQDDTITFLMGCRSTNHSIPQPVPFDSPLAEPMRQALLGHSGSIVGLDYYGVMVLAAFEPTSVSGMGMVAKINLAEVRAPYIRAGLISLGLALIFIVAGTILFYVISGPILVELQSHTTALKREVAERTRAEQDLRLNEERLRLAMEATNDGLFDWNFETGQFFFSPRYYTMLGYEPNEFPAGYDSWKTLVHPEDITGAEALVAEYSTLKRDQHSVEFRMRTKSGQWLWILSRAKIIEWDTQGRPIRMIGTHTDITDLRQAEIERNRFFTLSVDMLCVMGLDGYFKQVNPAWGKNLGWSREELLNRPLLDFVHPDDQEETLKIRARLATGEKILGFENRYRCTDGSYKVFSWNSFPLPGEQLVFGVARDITEHKELEEKLRQTQKMEGIGQLAGGIAHDFNNMLSPILGYTEMLVESISPKDPRHGQLKDIQTAANRAKDLTRQLLAFGRKQLLAMKTIDVNLVIQGFERILRRTIREDVAIEYSLDREALTVTADPGQIEQILMNLAVNAQDAMPQGGTLNIETSLIFLDEDYAKRHPSIIPGPHVLICVSDTGVGMAESTLAQVFDPFFTTKEVGQGTGLGLATVHGIVNQHKGSIWVYSEPGQGTTFKIYLPFNEEAPSQIEKQIDSPDGSGSGETVLVVEDNHMVRNLAETILKSKGFNVLTAASPDECLVFMADKITQVNLLLTDVVMPGMNGRELYDQLKNSYPKLKVIFMSGYSKNVIAHHGMLDQGVVFISKPFSVLDLTSKVREVLDS